MVEEGNLHIPEHQALLMEREDTSGCGLDLYSERRSGQVFPERMQDYGTHTMYSTACASDPFHRVFEEPFRECCYLLKLQRLEGSHLNTVNNVGLKPLSTGQKQVLTTFLCTFGWKSASITSKEAVRLQKQYPLWAMAYLRLHRRRQSSNPCLDVKWVGEVAFHPVRANGVLLANDCGPKLIAYHLTLSLCTGHRSPLQKSFIRQELGL